MKSCRKLSAEISRIIPIGTGREKVCVLDQRRLAVRVNCESRFFSEDREIVGHLLEYVE